MKRIRLVNKIILIITILGIIISCDPYPNQNIAMKEELLGKWSWRKSISLDSLNVQTPASRGITSAYVFYDSDLVEFYQNDSLYNTCPFNLVLQWSESRSFKLMIDNNIYDAVLYADTLKWLSNNYNHYFIRSK